MLFTSEIRIDKGASLSEIRLAKDTLYKRLGAEAAKKTAEDFPTQTPPNVGYDLIRVGMHCLTLEEMDDLNTFLKKNLTAKQRAELKEILK